MSYSEEWYGSLMVAYHSSLLSLHLSWDAVLMMKLHVGNNDLWNDVILSPALDSKAELKMIYNLPLSDWYSVGIELGIFENTLKLIKKNNDGDFNAQKREMFSTWLCQDVKATYRKLVEVLVKPDLPEPEVESAEKLVTSLG